MARLKLATLLVATLSFAACDDDDGDESEAAVTEVRAGDGLTGGGATEVVSLAVDFTKVARTTHGHMFSEITGVPNATTPGATCPAGQKATGVNVAAGTVTCAADLDTDTDTLGDLSCPEGQVAQFKSGAWACGTVAGGGGTVTSVTAGTGLTGGTITTTGTLGVDFTAVASADHMHPETTQTWELVSPTAVEFDGLVGIGRPPTVALEVQDVNANLVLHDLAGGNSAVIVLEDTQASGGPLNLIFRRLDALGQIASTGSIFLAGDNSLAYQTEGTAHRFKISGAKEAMRIAGDSGFVGINTPTPTNFLAVSNGVTTATCDGANWINASTRASKEGIQAFRDDDYRRIRKWLDETEVVWYRYRGDKDPRTRVGLIAEDVPAVLATADRKGISTADAVGFLTAATKQLATENERLQRENQELTGRLSRIEKRLAQLEHAR
jgi:hypothetical protein